MMYFFLVNWFAINDASGHLDFTKTGTWCFCCGLTAVWAGCPLGFPCCRAVLWSVTLSPYQNPQVWAVHSASCCPPVLWVSQPPMLPLLAGWNPGGGKCALQSPMCIPIYHWREISRRTLMAEEAAKGKAQLHAFNYLGSVEAALHRWWQELCAVLPASYAAKQMAALALRCVLLHGYRQKGIWRRCRGPQSSMPCTHHAVTFAELGSVR